MFLVNFTSVVSYLKMYFEGSDVIVVKKKSLLKVCSNSCCKRYNGSRAPGFTNRADKNYKNHNVITIVTTIIIIMIIIIIIIKLL